MGIAAIISQKWVTWVEESEALASEHSQCWLRKFHAYASLSFGSWSDDELYATHSKEGGFQLCAMKHNQFVENGFKVLNGHINIHIRLAIETLLVHCRAVKFWLDYVIMLVSYKRFGSVGGFWTGVVKGLLVVAYCIPWAFLPRVMCGHRDGPWGLHNNYVTFPKFKHQAVIFVSDCLPFMTRNLNTLSITGCHMEKCCCIGKKNFWECR